MRSLVAAVLLFLSALAASAQTGSGTITGNITDADGGVVAKASVQAKNVETNASGVWWGPRPVDLEQPRELPAMLPWAAALAKERTDNNNKDSPGARCLPPSSGITYNRQRI